MADPFLSAKAVLRRANKHIADLESATESYRIGKPPPYTFAVEFDTNFGKHLLKAKFDTRIFEDMSCIIFDAINNLRSCLDQMTHAIAVQHTKTDSVSAHFPFSSCASEFPNSIKGLEKHNKVPPEILTLFEWFKPYKGGDNTLWAVNYVANMKKHAKLIPVGTGAGAMLTFPAGVSPSGEFVSTPAHLNRKDEIIILAVNPDAPIPQMYLSTFVVFDDPEEVIQNKQPVSLLKIMSGNVANVLRDVEAVCEGIGIFQQHCSSQCT